MSGLEKLSEIEQKELVDMINLVTEHRLTTNFISETFKNHCYKGIPDDKINFQPTHYAYHLLCSFVYSISIGELVYVDKEQIAKGCDCYRETNTEVHRDGGISIGDLK